MNLFAYVKNNPINKTDFLGLFIGQMPPPPTGYNSYWQSGRYPNGKFWVQDPVTGKRWVAHPEDEGHWRHWDGPGRDERWPPNSKKYRDNQKKRDSDRCEKDPSGDAKGWEPTEMTDTDPFSPNNFIPFIMPYPAITVPTTPTVEVPVIPDPVLVY